MGNERIANPDFVIRGRGEALSDLEIKVGGNIAHFKRTMIYAGDL